MRSADEAGYHPDVVPLSVDERLIDACKLDLCGAADVDEKRLADECSYCPKLLVVFTSQGGGALLAEATAFLDRARKLAPDFRAAFVIVSSSIRGDEGSLDFVTGTPDDHVLRLLDETQDRLFRSYLHTRIAWESGGAIGVARALELALGVCRMGDDEAFESGLNAFASERYRSVPLPLIRTIDEILDALTRNQPREAQRLAGEPRGHGLLWSPFGRERYRLVPWVARALLLKNAAHDCAHLLRSHASCAPFAREILGRCLELEARERSKLSWSLGTSPPPQEASIRFASFRRGEIDGDSYSYPQCAPTRPTDAWAFAEFGAFIEAAVRTKAPDLPRRELHALRQLRNALAHGHYASWSTLRRLLEIERRLGAAF